MYITLYRYSKLYTVSNYNLKFSYMFKHFFMEKNLSETLYNIFTFKFVNNQFTYTLQFISNSVKQILLNVKFVMLYVSKTEIVLYTYVDMRV